MATKGKNKSTGVWAILLALIVLAGAIGGFAYATNGFKTEPRTVDVTYNDKLIDNTVIAVTNDVEVAFSVRDKFGSSDIPFSCAIVANNNVSNIFFTVDGSPKKMSVIKNYASFFNLKINKNNITLSSDWDIEAYLADYFDVAVEKVTPPALPNSEVAYFDLVITSGKQTIKCGLSKVVRVNEITLDQDKVEFIWGENNASD